MAVGLTQPLNGNEYQGYVLGGKGGRCVGMTTFPPSCSECLEIPGALSCWNPQACIDIVLPVLLLFSDRPRRGLVGNINNNFENLGYEGLKCV